jgi:hypothetical protein
VCVWGGGGGRVKVKLSLFFLTKHHAMKAYWGSGRIAPLILNLSTAWRWVVSLTPRPLCVRWKSPRYPLDRRLYRPRNRSERDGEVKNPCPCRESNPGRPACSSVAILTELRINSRFSMSTCVVLHFHFPGDDRMTAITETRDLQLSVGS